MRVREFLFREYVEIKCQLDATEVFIADLIDCSTFYFHILTMMHGQNHIKFFFVLTEEHKLRTFEDIVLRRIFCPKRL